MSAAVPANSEGREPVGPRSQSARSAATRRKIVEGARLAFAEKGYHATRIVDITDSADVALGNFYRHFSDKNEIFEEVLTPVFEGMFEVSGRDTDETSVRTIEALIARNIRYIEYFAEHKKLFRAGYEAAASAASDQFFPTWFKLREVFFVRTRNWLGGLVRSGDLRSDIDIELMAEALGAMNEQFIYIRVVRTEGMPTAADVKKMAHALADIWWLTLFEQRDYEFKKTKE